MHIPQIFNLTPSTEMQSVHSELESLRLHIKYVMQ